MSTSAPDGSPPGGDKDKGKGRASQPTTPSSHRSKKTPTPGSKTPGSGGRASSSGSHPSTPTHKGGSASSPLTGAAAGSPASKRSTPQKGPGSTPTTPVRPGTSRSAKSTPSKKYPSSDGTSKEKATWSETFRRDPTQRSVIVERLLPPGPKWIRETLAMARQYEGTANFYDGETLQQLTTLPGSSGYNPHPSTAFSHQFGQIEHTEGQHEEAGDPVGHDENLDVEDDDDDDDDSSTS